MHSLAGQGVKEHRKRCHESLSFSCSHLGNLSLMKNDTADELHIIMDHIPCHLVSAGHPMVLPESIVALYGDEFLRSAEVSVKVRSLHPDHRIFLETTGCRLHDGECLRQNLVEHLLDSLVYLLHKLVRLCRKLLLLLKRYFLFELLHDFCHTSLISRNGRLYLFLESIAPFPELIVREGIYNSVCFKHFIQCRLDRLHVSVRL